MSLKEIFCEAQLKEFLTIGFFFFFFQPCKKPKLAKRRSFCSQREEEGDRETDRHREREERRKMREKGERTISG